MYECVFFNLQYLLCFLFLSRPSEIEKDSDAWAGDQSLGSPVQRLLGRQKCVDTTTTPTGAPSTPTTTFAPSQLPSAISSMTHAPWQLDMYTKPALQPTSPQPQPLQLTTPAVERLLPIGGSRPCMFMQLFSLFTKKLIYCAHSILVYIFRY